MEGSTTLSEQALADAAARGARVARQAADDEHAKDQGIMGLEAASQSVMVALVALRRWCPAIYVPDAARTELEQALEKLERKREELGR